MGDLNDLQRRVGEWGERTFPDATDYSIVAHLRDEVRELTYAVVEIQEEVDAGNAIHSNDNLQTEAADCLLLLLHLAHRNGFSLFDAAVVKVAINEKRTWNTVAPGGYVKHDEVTK